MSKRSLCWVNPSPKSRSKSDAPKSKASSKLNRSVKSVFITLGVGWRFNNHKDRGYLAKWGWGVHLLVVFVIFVVEFIASVFGGLLHQSGIAVPVRMLYIKARGYT